MQPEQVYRAARRYVELGEFLRRFREVLSDAIDRLTGFEREFGSRRTPTDKSEIEARLTRCEYAVHDCLNYVYMANELADSVTRRFSSVGIGGTPLHDELSVQIGLRNGYCHNGLLGMNVTSTATAAYVILPLENVERFADWDDARHPDSFESHFGDTDDTLVVRRLLQQAEAPTVSLVRTLCDGLEEISPTERFEEYVRSHPIYRSP